MMISDLITENLIVTGVVCSNKEEVLKQLFEMLYADGCVEETFYEEILKREKIYPTGLELLGCNVAIPHVSPDQVKKSAIAIAVLKTPVIFNRMDDVNLEVEVKVIFNIALANGGKQVEVLQKLTALITDEAFMEKVLEAKTPKEVQTIFKNGGKK
ncbi:PTS sugar transporter subunit IIA [Fusibacter ferrireducens]|uniref:PTS sugar transporter subunit IIA n=1 Tax=Fusibacter ferrireducens TaxID=2785058 RepID=A0ABR9ZZ99_9FIRM|nr:PTS sugar transporter subunit IIA [Fusibacter ferrireducens]MBF4695777.1 PTS sugar transporter subunit IIA [Fusibacter ferrireducens]